MQLLQTLEEYWGRYESDDIYYMMITLINKFVVRVPELQSMQVRSRSQLKSELCIMSFGSTAKVLAECKLKYYISSECSAAPVPAAGHTVWNQDSTPG